jgi:hypothetical protein
MELRLRTRLAILGIPSLGAIVAGEIECQPVQLVTMDAVVVVSELVVIFASSLHSNHSTKQTHDDGDDELSNRNPSADTSNADELSDESYQGGRGRNSSI